MRAPSARKTPGFWLICGLIAALAGPAAAVSVRAPDAAAQLIHDSNSGSAIYGYDPVAYHTEGRAVQGEQRFTAEALGFVWRFTSAANRAAFLAEPRSYLPVFGGHDATGVGEGRMVQGDPAIFLIAGGQTAFFRTEEARDRFARDANLRKKAAENWPRVAAQFAGH